VDVNRADRRSNTFIFSVSEDRDAIKWWSNVDGILLFVADRSVDIADIFR
jgi:hypothetical protein